MWEEMRINFYVLSICYVDFRLNLLVFKFIHIKVVKQYEEDL